MTIPSQVIAVLQAQTRAWRRLAPPYRNRLRKLAKKTVDKLLTEMVKAVPGSAAEARLAEHVVALETVLESSAAEYGEGLASTVEDLGRKASNVSRIYLRRQLQMWRHGGSVPDLRAAGDILADGLLEHYQNAGSKWSSQAIVQMRTAMSESILAGESIPQTWQRMAQKLGMSESDAERIVRTETSTAAHRRQLEDMIAFDDGEDEWRKQLVTVFDDRTEEDSVVVHRQTRRLTEPFVSPLLGNKEFQHPPDRPNDRGTMVFVPVDSL